jgi:hypothetical protein
MRAKSNLGLDQKFVEILIPVEMVTCKVCSDYDEGDVLAYD